MSESHAANESSAEKAIEHSSFLIKALNEENPEQQS